SQWRSGDHPKTAGARRLRRPPAHLDTNAARRRHGHWRPAVRGPLQSDLIGGTPPECARGSGDGRTPSAHSTQLTHLTFLMATTRTRIRGEHPIARADCLDDSCTMSVLLHDCEIGLYYAGPGHWTTDLRQAVNFNSVEAAEQL